MYILVYIYIYLVVIAIAYFIRQISIFWDFAICTVVFFLVIACLMWYRKAWSYFCGTVLITGPRQKLSYWIYKLSDKAQKSLKFRTIVYLSIVLIQFCLITMQMVTYTQANIQEYRHVVQNEMVSFT